MIHSWNWCLGRSFCFNSSRFLSPGVVLEEFLSPWIRPLLRFLSYGAVASRLGLHFSRGFHVIKELFSFGALAFGACLRISGASFVTSELLPPGSLAICGWSFQSRHLVVGVGCRAAGPSVAGAERHMAWLRGASAWHGELGIFTTSTRIVMARTSNLGLGQKSGLRDLSLRCVALGIGDLHT